LLWDILPAGCTVSLTDGEKGELRRLMELEYGSVEVASKALGIEWIDDNRLDKLETALGELRRITKALGVEEEWSRAIHLYASSPIKTARITPELAYVCGFAFGNGGAKITKRRSIGRHEPVSKEYGMPARIRKVLDFLL